MTFSIFQQSQNTLEKLNIFCEGIAQVDSTNNLAKAQAFSCQEPLKVYLTDHQTLGRGRGDHKWENPEAGSSLMSSWSFSLSKAPQHTTGPRAGLALYKTVSEIWPNLEWSIKPPNDLFLGDKKVAGFLVESIHQGSLFRLIIGLGFNVFSHPETVPTAGHLSSSTSEGELTPDAWGSFLEKLKSELELVAKLCVEETLAPHDCELLLQAINKFPHRKSPYKEVKSDGSLVCENRELSWKDL